MTGSCFEAEGLLESLWGSLFYNLSGFPGMQPIFSFTSLNFKENISPLVTLHSANIVWTFFFKCPYTSLIQTS